MTGEAHGFVWQFIVLAIEQAGRAAAAAGNPPEGVFAFHTENARLIGVGFGFICVTSFFWIVSGSNDTGFEDGSLFTIPPKEEPRNQGTVNKSAGTKKCRSSEEERH